MTCTPAYAAVSWRVRIRLKYFGIERHSSFEAGLAEPVSLHPDYENLKPPLGQHLRPALLVAERGPSQVEIQA